jgi:predicted regulator of Ras-like GTPase activity (Roadblock/LC7/MglB family)
LHRGNVDDAMDAAQALADLTEISSQIEAAVLFDGDGQVAGSTLADGDAATLARAAGELLNQAAGLGDGEVAQIEASTPDGNLFVVRVGARRIAATTGPDPTTGLVFYDLKSALRGSSTDEKPRRRRAPKKADDAA